MLGQYTPEALSRNMMVPGLPSGNFLPGGLGDKNARDLHTVMNMYAQQHKKENTMSTMHENVELSTKHNKENAMSENNQQEELLTVHEVALLLRVDDTTVRRWIKSGALSAIALPYRGKRQGYRIRKSTLDNLFASPSPALE